MGGKLVERVLISKNKNGKTTEVAIATTPERLREIASELEKNGSWRETSHRLPILWIEEEFIK